jgi:REP element-mobilizing transposase RayT
LTKRDCFDKITSNKNEKEFIFMARPLRIEYEGALYHITSRGNEKKEIFKNDTDRRRFLSYLQDIHQRFNIIVHAWCLMNNHYHLLMETPLANLSRSMQKLNSSYTTYYNVKHERVGHLFQGRYKAILIDKDAYLQEVSRYIHLNPVRAKVTANPEKYPWSSYRYYINAGIYPEYLKIGLILEYFSEQQEKARKRYREFVKEGLGESNPFKEISAGCILGNRRFVEEIKDRYVDKKKKQRDLPSLRELNKSAISGEDIINFVERNKDISEKRKAKIKVYFLRKYTGDTLEEISAKLRRRFSPAGVSQSFLRSKRLIQEDREFKKKIERMERKLLNVEV